MTDNNDIEIEERLRRHYRHLREVGPPPKPARQSAPMLAIAAAVAMLLVGGGSLALADRGGGQPVQADLGSTVGSGTISTTTVLKVEPDADPDKGPTTSSDSPGLAPDTDLDKPEPDSSDAAPKPDAGDRSPKPGTVSPPAGSILSAAYGIWAPSGPDTCSAEIHDRYWVYGPDGKVYPTYHPPVDPETGCTFGHDHGRDPARSDLSDILYPFGYAYEQAAAADVTIGPQDHVGHKIEWHNNGGYYEPDSTNQDHDQTCDVAYKVHMNTHSDDAFSNNLHEVFHYARCENGSELIYRFIYRFGNQGEFNMLCDRVPGPAVVVGPVDGSNHSGNRGTPALECFGQMLLVPGGQASNWHYFGDRWRLSHTETTEEFGRFGVQFYFYTDNPARYWDGQGLARTVDLCYLEGDLQVRSDEYCQPMLEANPGTRVAWDDPASPFNGTERRVLMDRLRIENAAQQTNWYTDIFGTTWSTEPFPGSIEQYAGLVPIDANATRATSRTRTSDIGDDLGIHAPN